MTVPISTVSNIALFSFAVLSTAKEKYSSLCALRASSEAGGENKQMNKGVRLA
ncbi:MAG: hypothetical protein JRJ60_21690 [Deltaproteobacteria bacterium]|nr:hypothetical protein [Deltaproteobacteria bacterium]